MGVGTVVRQARETAGLSQEALARRTGLATRTIVRIEHDQNWSRGSLALIANALGMDTDVLLDHDEDATAAAGTSRDVPGSPARREGSGRKSSKTQPARSLASQRVGSERVE